MKTAMRSAALAALLVATTVHGYVRTRSTKKAPGIPSYWPARCVFVLPDNSTLTKDLPQDQVFSIINTALNNWLSADAACSYLQINVDAPAAGEAHYDGTNVIKFRQDEWCHPVDDQNLANDPGRCYDKSAAAITSVFMINDGGDKDGLILDADIELNNLNFTFLDVVPGQPTPAICQAGATGPKQGADLENTLTHELGHLQGLSHTCRDLASFPYDVDENGMTPPYCSALNSLPTDQRDTIINATMYNDAGPCETKKRHPSPDDVAGICNAYPSAMMRDSACVHTDLAKYTSRSACSMGGAGTPAAFLLVLFPLGLLARRRRS
jgi:hypothetical protein